MFIKEIELNNFRIYKGINKIELSVSSDKNVIIISGKNGFGKTTFLMSLVWALYGKQMQNVDDLYKKEIQDKGGYSKYIGNSLNRLAKSNSETSFSVSVTLSDVKIPDVTCNEVKITRRFDTANSYDDHVEVLIDGDHNELIDELNSSATNQPGEEIFIRDFILPLEIAKFFFFDAEKIVALAEVSSNEQRRNLSRAYTEVLGIKKYEDVKETLESILDSYRKKTASKNDKLALSEVETRIENAEIELDDIDKEISALEDERDEKRILSDELQEVLIRESEMSIEELNELKSQGDVLLRELEEIQETLSDYLDLIPFAFAGETVSEVLAQAKIEDNYRKSKYQHADILEKIGKVLDDLEQMKNSFPDVIPSNIRRFYEDSLENLIKKHFFGEALHMTNDFRPILNLADNEFEDLNHLVDTIKHSFESKFQIISSQYYSTRSNYEKIKRKILKAEKSADNEYITNVRTQKQIADNRIVTIDSEISTLTEKRGEQKGIIKENKQKQETLRNRIDESHRYGAAEAKTQALIKRLKSFIKTFKEDKKRSLEEGILKELDKLMHKKAFISKVIVDINPEGEDVDISLYDSRNNKIDKGDLSMGERQMYASALLKALVDESDIEFPVFIDSPLQKFDKDHAMNVVKEFYPHVSKQVLILPLLEKEMSQTEYESLLPRIEKSYLIDNISTDASQFVTCEPGELFDEFRKRTDAN